MGTQNAGCKGYVKKQEDSGCRGQGGHRMQDVRSMKNAGETRDADGTQNAVARMQWRVCSGANAGGTWNAACRWRVECRMTQNAKCWDAGIYFLQTDNSLNDQFYSNCFFNRPVQSFIY